MPSAYQIVPIKPYKEKNTKYMTRGSQTASHIFH